MKHKNLHAKAWRFFSLSKKCVFHAAPVNSVGQRIPHGSDTVRWGTNLSVSFADSSPWEGEPIGCGSHRLAPMGESWRAAPERGYSPHFADQQPVTYVSPETMAAPTGATLPLPSKTQDFHLIRPVRACPPFPEGEGLRMRSSSSYYGF